MMGTRTVGKDTEPFAGNRETEQAVVHLLLTKPAEALPLLAELCDLDFNWVDCQFVFNELQLMAQARVRIDDAKDVEQWLRRKEVKGRLHALGYHASQDPVYLFAKAGDYENAHSLTCAEIIADLRRWRKARALRLLGYHLSRMVDQQPSEPELVRAWLDEQLERMDSIKMELET